jgi:hypothetical protein
MTASTQLAAARWSLAAYEIADEQGEARQAERYTDPGNSFRYRLSRHSASYSNCTGEHEGRAPAVPA